MIRPLTLVVSAVFLLARPVASSAQSRSPYTQLGRDILRELVETNTTQSHGITAASEKLATRFREAGFPAADIQLVGPSDRNRNIIVRLRGRGTRKPILLMAHLDVVEARRDDWTIDPFQLNEKDGYLYGRGTLDVKGGAATLASAMLRLRQDGVVPDGDIILALTSDEEGGNENGVDWLLHNRKQLIDAEYAINVDAGGGDIRNGKNATMNVQAAEKVFLSFALTVRNAGGHSSLPSKDNAIYRLARGLDKLGRHDFPARLNDVTRAYFTRMAPIIGGTLAADMRAASRGDAAAIAKLSKSSNFYNAQFRTTCVATMLEGGHAENALPQLARATVNCRLLPDEDTAVVRRAIVHVVGDTAIAVTTISPAVPSPANAPSAAFTSMVERTMEPLWGKLPVVPTMETGATDGLYLRNAGMPVYGISGIFVDVNDVRAHGRDERILSRSFDEALEFTYRLLRAEAGGNPLPKTSNQ